MILKPFVGSLELYIQLTVRHESIHCQMRILAIETDHPEESSRNVKPLLEEEARRVWELYRDGHIREIWFTASDRRAVLLLECASEDQAIELLATLPLVRERCIAFDVLALKPYDGFERLFGGP
jgi:muconolactone delta-isomerase